MSCVTQCRTNRITMHVSHVYHICLRERERESERASAMHAPTAYASALSGASSISARNHETTNVQYRWKPRAKSESK